MKGSTKTRAEESDLSILKAKKKPFDMFRLLLHVRLCWPLIIIALGFSIAQGIISAKIPDATANLFNGDFSTEKLMNVIYTTLISLAMTLVIYFLNLFAQAKSSQNARKSIWKKLMNAKMPYYDANDPGALLNTVTTDAELIGTGFVSLFVTIPGYITYIIQCAQILATYNTQLLIMVLAILAIHILYMAFVGQWIQGVSRKAQIQMGYLTGFYAERVRNIPMIKSFGAQNAERKNGIEESAKVYKIGKKSALMSGVQSAYGAFCFVLATVVATICGCLLIQNGSITHYEFIGAYTYIIVLNVIFMAIGIYWTAIKILNGQAYRIARLCEAPSEEKKLFEKDNGKTEIENGDIKFDNVEFGYTRDKQIIKGVSFTIPQGKITALAGPSGSGKTTIFKLLENLYPVSGGSIKIGNQKIEQPNSDIAATDGLDDENFILGEVDISEFNITAWRNKLAYVVQDAGIFSGTLRDCLTYGVDREVSDEELIEATKLTGIYDFISTQPLGFLTPVAAWGSSLSGGQRQRVVITRALLRKADILIFDEPTSALDPETANAISKLIFENFDSKTVVIISHELNYITKADNIVFLNEGIVEAEGTHEQLMKTCETYKSLVEEQSYQEVFE